MPRTSGSKDQVVRWYHYILFKLYGERAQRARLLERHISRHPVRQLWAKRRDGVIVVVTAVELRNLYAIIPPAATFSGAIAIAQWSLCGLLSASRPRCSVSTYPLPERRVYEYGEEQKASCEYRRSAE